MKRVLMALALVVCMTLGVAASPEPAEAIAPNGGVYIVAPKWAGWCNTRLNRPTYMVQTNYTTGDSRADRGDDIIWSRVRLNTNNTIDVQVGCLTGSGSSGTRIQDS